MMHHTLGSSIDLCVLPTNLLIDLLGAVLGTSEYIDCGRVTDAVSVEFSLKRSGKIF